MRFFICAIGAFFGAAVGGIAGLIIGTILAYGFSLFASEKWSTDQPTEGFFLRHRLELLKFACNFGGVTVGIFTATKTEGSGPVFWVVEVIGGCAGGLAGHFIFDWLLGQLGWSGTSIKSEVQSSEIYIKTLLSAARADGVISDKEKQEIARVTKGLFSSIGHGAGRDLDDVVNNLSGDVVSMKNLCADIQTLPTQTKQSLQYDVFRLLCSDGGLSHGDEEWLVAFHEHAPFADWSIGGYFIRAGFRESPNQEMWLRELNLEPGATTDEIKRAYRRRAMEYHPDKLHGIPDQIRALAESKMKSVNAAYNALMSDRAHTGIFFYKDPNSRKSFSFSATTDEFVCACWLCNQKNRLKGASDQKTARCGNCHALLGLEFDPGESN